MDSVGIGGAKDADAYGDLGADTIGPELAWQPAVEAEERLVGDLAAKQRVDLCVDLLRRDDALEEPDADQDDREPEPDTRPEDEADEGAREGEGACAEEREPRRRPHRVDAEERLADHPEVWQPEVGEERPLERRDVLDRDRDAEDRLDAPDVAAEPLPRLPGDEDPEEDRDRAEDRTPAPPDAAGGPGGERADPSASAPPRPSSRSSTPVAPSALVLTWLTVSLVCASCCLSRRP